MSLAYAYAAAGRRSEVPKLLEEAKEKTNRMYVPVYRIAAVYVALSDKDQAIQWLEKAYHDDFGWMVYGSPPLRLPIPGLAAPHEFPVGVEMRKKIFKSAKQAAFRADAAVAAPGI